MRNTMFLIIILVFLAKTSIAQFTISGIIKDFDSQESLIGATIAINTNEIGTASNAKGEYYINTSNNLVKITASYVGYQSQTIELNLKKDTVINFLLKNKSLEEITIIDNRPAIERIGQSNMSIERIKLTPSILGETDPLKSLVFQPGISNGTEGTSTIHVRGGSADQNLMLIDGARVYNQGHLLGLLSVFNPSAVESVNIIKGGFLSKYGGRLSSIIDVNTKSANEQEMETELSIGTISSHFYLQKKLNERLSVMAAVRLGNLAIYTLPIQLFNSGIGGYSNSLGYWMYDTNFKLQYKINDHSYITANGYHGKDLFFRTEKSETGTRNVVFSQESLRLNWGNTVGSINYHRSKNNKTTKIQASYSGYELLFSFEDVGFDDATFSNFTETLLQSSSKIHDWSLNAEHTLEYDKWTHSIGSEGIYHFFEPSDVSLEKLDQPFPLPFEKTTHQTLETALFYQSQFKPTNKITLDGGLRLSLNRGIDATFVNLEPRLSIAYQTNEKSAFKINYSKMVQPMHLLSNTGSGLPTDVWIPISKAYQPQIAHQMDAGYHTSVSCFSFPIEIGAEVFYKKMKHLVDYASSTPILFNVSQRWDLLLANEGKGYAYGAEFSTAKETGKFKTWVAYTLMWSYRQFDNLNNGNWFPHRYDRRHDISWTSAYQLSKKWDVATNFVFSTGSPYTAFNTFIIDIYGEPSIFATEKHGERLPNYHRLDIVFNYKKTKQKKNREVKWSFGLYNSYTQKNIFSLENLVETTSQDAETISFDYTLQGLSFLRAIPFVTYSIQF